VKPSNERGKPAGRKDTQAAIDGKVPTEDRDSDKRIETGTKPMARFEISTTEMVMMGGKSSAEALCELGVNYATGRGCAVDRVAAHKWLNIAAIKGSDRAAELRADVGAMLTKIELAAALRAARDWMTTH
jgi:hypothetical protein